MIHCVPNPEAPGRWGFAHICADCGAHGPVVGTFPSKRDESEAQTLGIQCKGPENGGSCLAHRAGWLTGGKVDLCKACKKSRGIP